MAIYTIEYRQKQTTPQKAVARYLERHNDLGIHSELFVPAMVDLIEKGIVTDRKKTLHPRKNIFTVASGTKRMYEFMHDNPSMESYPASYVLDPAIIAKNDNMISVNSILEVSPYWLFIPPLRAKRSLVSYHVLKQALPPRMDTHYLVTEYGVVNLKGKSTRKRALDIISIARPKFRDDLLREAENMYLL